jgi:hypothetical protein
MHELSSAERNAQYRRFFELQNNPPGLRQVILNLISVSYRKIYSVMHQLHNRKVSEKHLLIMVNCFSLKISIFNKRNNCTLYTFDVIMLFYISLPGWSNIKLCTMVHRERFSVFWVDHWVQKSGHPWYRERTTPQLQGDVGLLQQCDLCYVKQLVSRWHGHAITRKACLTSEDGFVITCVANLMEVKVLYVQQDLRYEISSCWRFNM